MATKEELIDKELDLSNAGRGVWLVKVPKYIANKWEKAPGNIDVGKLKISKIPGQKAQVSLSLSEAVMNLDPQEKIPKDHRLDVSVVTKQTLGVFSHLVKTEETDNEKLFMEGRIVQKLECRPVADNTYMKLKLESIKKASVPQRKVQPLDKIVNTFKPISRHKHDVSIVGGGKLIEFLYNMEKQNSLCRSNTRRARQRRARRREMTRRRCWTCCSTRSRSTSTTTLRTWSRSRTSPCRI